MGPSELDSRRAALCCLAVKQDCPEGVRRLFGRHPELNFRNVVIPTSARKSRKNEPVKLLFATAVDGSGESVVYVTFKGNPRLADILHGSHEGDLSVFETNPGKHGCRNHESGYFHEIFYDRLLNSVPSVDRILQYAENLMESSSGSLNGKSNLLTTGRRYRVVFCGHGSGGALSHMAMLTYLLSLSSMSSRDSNHPSIIRDIIEDNDNLISISFGAPLFSDECTISSFKSKVGNSVENHFFNFFAKLDPVPFVLFGLPSQEGEEKSYKKVRENFSRALSEIGSLVDSAKAADLDNDGYVRDSLTRLLNSSRKRLAGIYDQLSSIDGLNPYGLFGRYFDVSGAAVCGSFNPVTAGSSEVERLARQRISSFAQVPYLEAHAMISYFKAVNGGHERSRAYSPLSLCTIAVGDPPEVKRASVVILPGEKKRLDMARIEVRGRNLSLLLQRRCSISALHGDRWSVIAANDKTIVWETTHALTEGELKQLEKSGQGSPTVKIRLETSFGRMKNFAEVPLRNTTAGSFAVEALKHVLGKMVIMATTEGPTDFRQSVKKIREGVETLARVAGMPETWVRSVESILKSPRYTVTRKKEILDERISRQIFEELCEKPMVVEFDEDGESGLKDTVDYLMGVVQIVLSFINPLAGIAAIALMLGVKGILLLVQYMFRSKSLELRTYEEIIKFLYNEIILQSSKGEQDEEPISIVNSQDNRPPASDLEAVSIRFCEQAIHWYAEKVGFDNITFGSKLKYKPEVYERMKARIRLVHAIQRIYGMAKRNKLLAVVGTENAGKSTLINVLKRHYSSSSFVEDNVPDADTGFWSHTSEVEGFYIGKNCIAVDFPGVGGADTDRSDTWKSFEKVPDLCIVMVKFSGDVDHTCQNLRSIFSEKLCARYILLVNQVDCILKGKPGAKVWKEYNLEAVEKLRDQYRLRSFSNEVAVYMSCLNDEDLYESERQELKVRGILFGNDVAHKICELLDVDNT